MKILLFYPPMTIKGDDTTQPGIVAPLGLSNIAAFVEREGYDVKICDALAEGCDTQIRGKNFLRIGLTQEEIAEKIKYHRPDIVGVSVMFTAFARDAHEIAKIVKKISPKTLVVFGGAHPSVASHRVLLDKNVDISVIGEGEETFLEIVKKYENEKSLKNIIGTVVRKNGKIYNNRPRPYIKDLDSLPLTARHLLPMDIYLRGQALDKDISYNMRHPFADMVSSRGCPNNCIYCAVPKIWGRRWRPFSAQRVLTEIKHLISRYGIKEIHFLDDNVSVDKKRLEQICDGLIKEKIDIKWTCPNGIAIWTLDKRLLKKMKKSGCYRLTFGIESGSRETQEFIRKRLNLKKAQKIMKMAADLGLWTFSTYIIGFPYESIESMNQTFDYAIKSNCDFVAFILLMPFPGTDVTEIMIKEKLIKRSDLDEAKIGALLSGYKGSANRFLTPDELNNIQNNAHKRLLRSRLLWPLFKPKYLFSKINSTEDFWYLIKIAKNYVNMFINTIKLGGFKTHRIRKAMDLKLISSNNNQRQL